MAYATVREGDHLLIQTIDRDAAPVESTHAAVSLSRDLPDVDREARHASWLWSRSLTYIRRSQVRQASWRASAYDIHHIHYANRFTDAISGLPRPLVMNVHDIVPHVPRLGRRAERAVLARLYRRPDRLIVHHPTLADGLCRQFGVPLEVIRVIDYPVLTAGSLSNPPPHAPPVVMMFGALRPNKGLEVFAEAIHRLSGLDATFVIAGRGDAQLEGQARALAATDQRVRVEIGFISEDRKRELFQSASVVALPYTSFASQSAVLQDAYGFGRPVVAADVGALGDAVREDGTGVVVAPQNPEQLAIGIRQLIDPARWAPAAASARSVAERRTPERYGAALRAVYEELL